MTYYEHLAAQGLAYGPAFGGLSALGGRDGEALAQLALPPTNGANPKKYRIPPALLDACFQALGAALPIIESENRSGPALPVGVDRLQLYGNPDTAVWAYGRLNS